MLEYYILSKKNIPIHFGLFYTLQWYNNIKSNHFS